MMVSCACFCGWRARASVLVRLWFLRLRVSFRGAVALRVQTVFWLLILLFRVG